MWRVYYVADGLGNEKIPLDKCVTDREAERVKQEWLEETDFHPEDIWIEEVERFALGKPQELQDLNEEEWFEYEKPQGR